MITDESFTYHHVYHVIIRCLVWNHLHPINHHTNHITPTYPFIISKFLTVVFLHILLFTYLCLLFLNETLPSCIISNCILNRKISSKSENIFSSSECAMHCTCKLENTNYQYFQTKPIPLDSAWDTNTNGMKIIMILNNF
jgi:hypothetical protein